MKKQICLYCYKELNDSRKEYHDGCSKIIFDTIEPPLLEYTNEQMLELAEKIVKSYTSVTGVQSKLSLGIERLSDTNIIKKFAIVGVLGNYILKPPSTAYPQLPELEDLTMNLASIAGIDTVKHSLIRLKSGELSYITKRVDRQGERKFHIEDMCQLTNRLTEHKYRGSYEQIGKAIVKYSITPD